MGTRRVSLAVVVVLVTAFPLMGAQRHDVPPPRSVEAQPNVLFLALDDFTRPYMRLMFEAFTDAVAKAPNPPAIFFESLDASRFEEPEYLGNLREWLRRKYSARRID